MEWSGWLKWVREFYFFCFLLHLVAGSFLLSWGKSLLSTISAFCLFWFFQIFVNYVTRWYYWFAKLLFHKANSEPLKKNLNSAKKTVPTQKLFTTQKIVASYQIFLKLKWNTWGKIKVALLDFLCRKSSYSTFLFQNWIELRVLTITCSKKQWFILQNLPETKKKTIISQKLTQK